MLELQRRRLIHPAHESLHQRPLGGFDRVDPRAVDRFDGDRGLQPVEGLVHIHHHQVRAVAVLAVT